MIEFDFPASRLTDLDDAALRELVARLCEAEREMDGGHRAEVRWGGAQQAGDGGVDVMVHALGPYTGTPVLPRGLVGIQVKKEDLGERKIIKEMRPSGTLRESLRDLACKAGAYLIVSAGVSCSKRMLEDRQRAMRQAVSDIAEASDLHTDFVDRHALARWVGMHPSVSLWLRSHLGMPTLRGWHGYGRWTATPAGLDDTLIVGSGLRIKLPGSDPIDDLVEALEAIRRLIRQGDRAIRIAGLSGTGKTRLAQALFEQTGTDEPLETSRAIYTDLGQDPDPLPLQMLNSLLASKSSNILIVDNCPPEAHRTLAEQLAKSGGSVKLLTIEYDVRDDRSSETDVVRIEAVGTDIAAQLIHRRHPDRSSEDARRLADLAIGNARLALALADAVPDAASLSSFGDDALFGRLFWQREQPDQQFEFSAEVLSLVYSFDVDGDVAPHELKFLADLSGLPRHILGRHAALLVDRGLAQVRGRWRAVLPHALANRLAKHAIQRMSWRELSVAFGSREAVRLRRSFARRLAYLHDMPEVQRIIREWMTDGGPLDLAVGIEAYDLDLLERICHLAPLEALELLPHLIRASFERQYYEPRVGQFARMLARLAHSPEHFDTAMTILVEIAALSKEQKNSPPVEAIRSLSGLYLSGTLALAPQRIAVARQAIQSHDVSVVECGMVMLESALSSTGWSSWSAHFDDARPEAFGWRPSRLEALDWYRDWMAFGLTIAGSETASVSLKVRKILASTFKRFWLKLPELRGDIEIYAMLLNREQYWAEGWNALSALHQRTSRSDFDHEAADLDRLFRLVEMLRPTGPLDTVRALLRSGAYGALQAYLLVPDGYEVAIRQHSTLLREAGGALAANPDLIDLLGAELFTARSNNPREIGRGIGLSTEDGSGLWNKLRDQFLSVSAERPDTSILAGYLLGLDQRCPALTDQIRNDCLQSSSLRKIFPSLVPPGMLSAANFARLLEVASDPDLRAIEFEQFVSDTKNGLSDEQRGNLLGAMQRGAAGGEAVIEALCQLVHSEKEAPRQWPLHLREAGISAIERLLSGGSERFSDDLDYRAAELVPKCLLPDDTISAVQLVDAVAAHARKRYGSLFDIERTVAAIAARAPIVFLDRMLAVEGAILARGQTCNLQVAPLDAVNSKVLVEWCQTGSDNRWVLVSRAITPYGSGDEYGFEKEPVALSEQALALLTAAPAPEIIVSVLAEHVTPISWGGSRASIMDRRLTAFEQLSHHPDASVRREVERHAIELRKIIVEAQRSERERVRARKVSFED